MFLGIRKKYWLYLGTILLLVGLVLFLNLSPVFAWKRSEVKGPFAEQLQRQLSDKNSEGKNIFRLDKSSLLSSGLERDEIENIRLRLALPDGISAEVNRFEPVALVAGKDGQMTGIDRFCRIVPYDCDWENIDLPVLSGLKQKGLFEAPLDYRVYEVIQSLIEIESELPELHGQLAEIDFSDRVYLMVYLTSSQKRYKAVSDGFMRQLVKLAAVGSVDDWAEIGCYNLTYNGIVIRED